MRINPLRSQRFGALLLGAASVLAFAPVGAFPLLWLTLGLLFELLCRTVEQARGARRGALLGGASVSASSSPVSRGSMSA